MSGFAAPIGIHDFRDLRESGATYVDKTEFVAQVLGRPTKVSLFTRPRRFGKMLNLSTVRYFAERSSTDRSALFEGLAIWDDTVTRRHFGRYPVVSLTFKDITADCFESAFAAIRELLAETVQAHAELLDSDRVGRYDRSKLERLLMAEASEEECWRALKVLSRALEQHHGSPVILLIDEYDTPVQQGYLHGYHDDAVRFSRNFLGGGLKDNDHLFKGIVTGILQVAKESIFSGLNNLDTFTTLRREHATHFGFTRPEVEWLASEAEAAERLDSLAEWYDGYRFGEAVIYNPWSVLKYLAAEESRPLPYWRATGSDEILRRMLVGRAACLADQEILLSGGAIDKAIVEPIALRDVDTRPEAVWSFLLFSGYLSADRVRHGDHEMRARLMIPNREVRGIYESVFVGWLRDALGGEGDLDTLMRARV